MIKCCSRGVKNVFVPSFQNIYTQTLEHSLLSFHKQMAKAYQVITRYTKTGQYLGTKLWNVQKNKILQMVKLKLSTNLLKRYQTWSSISSWDKLFDNTWSNLSCCGELLINWHDDVIKWKHFPRYWPFVRGIHRSRWIPRTKASDAKLWGFLWSTPESSKQSWGWWFEMPSWSLWRRCNG